MTFNWSKKPFLWGFVYSLLICGIGNFLNLSFSIPWQPISIIGIAVAFYLGFKNNSSYDRTWEARKIWGSIVNNSRSLGAAVVSFIQGEHAKDVKKEILYRHIAWLTALRHQLRLSRPWEHLESRLNGLYASSMGEDFTNQLSKELSKYIERDELKKLEGKANIATQILRNQSERFQALKDEGYYEDFRHMEFFHLIVGFYEDQGKSERIKNFPFPRQYASTALWLTMVFCFFVPWGLLDVFREQNNWQFWLCPFLSALIIWIFFLMEKIGDYSENPFEGTYNDVPISSISRGIEIDLRQMIDDADIPEPVSDQDGFLL